jgi:hypothetical protein
MRINHLGGIGIDGRILEDLRMRTGFIWVRTDSMYLGEVGWGDVDWTGLAQDRNRWRALVNSALNLRVP